LFSDCENKACLLSLAMDIVGGYMDVVVAFRTGRKGSLEIDGFSFVEGESGGVLRMLNTRGNMYIGKSHMLNIHGNMCLISLHISHAEYMAWQHVY